MLPRLLRITSKVYLYDTSAPGLLDTGLLRLLRRVRWSCGQCAFALYTVPRRTDHALLLHYAAESVRLRHGCPQNTNLQQQHQHLPYFPPLFSTLLDQCTSRTGRPRNQRIASEGATELPTAPEDEAGGLDAPGPCAGPRRTRDFKPDFGTKCTHKSSHPLSFD